jgi:GNAT superfamily N-acetyltransferase
MEYRKIEAEEASIRTFAPVLSDRAILSLVRKEPTVGFGCLVEGQPAAACVSAVQSDGAEILSLFVLPEYRRMGIGRALLSRLYWELFYTTDASCIIASYNLLPGEDTDALTALLRTAGYRFDLHPGDYRLLEFRVSDLTVPKTGTAERALPFSSLGKYYTGLIGEKLRSMGFTDTRTCPETTDYDLSMAVFREQRLLSFVWVEKLRDIYRLAAVYNSASNPGHISSMLLQAIGNAKKRLPPDTVVVADVYDEVSAKLLSRLTGGCAKPSQRLMDAVLIL